MSLYCKATHHALQHEAFLFVLIVTVVVIHVQNLDIVFFFQNISCTCVLFIFTIIDCNKVRKEGRKRTGLAREDSGEFYLQINLNRCALCVS